MKRTRKRITDIRLIVESLQFVVFIADCCYGEQRAQLWTEPGGTGEDRAEVRPRPGAASGGLDSCAVWGGSGAPTTRERQLPKVANGRHGEWLACTQNRNYIKLFKQNRASLSDLKSPWGKDD